MRSLFLIETYKFLDPTKIMSWLQLQYSKSVGDLVQWSLRVLRDPQALSTTLCFAQDVTNGSLKPCIHRDLGLDLLTIIVVKA